MTISNSIKDREFDRFRGSSKVDTRVAVEVENDSQNPVPVEFSSGEVFNIYNQVTSVAVAATQNIVTDTVPAGKYASIKLIEVSGCNLSAYEILIDGSISARKLTTYGQYNETFIFSDLIVTEGKVIIARAINTSGNINDYDARIVISVRDN